MIETKSDEPYTQDYVQNLFIICLFRKFESFDKIIKAMDAPFQRENTTEVKIEKINFEDVPLH